MLHFPYKVAPAQGGDNMKIKRESRRIIELVIMRYPERKKEYEEYISDIMTSNKNDDMAAVQEENGIHNSVTEAKALKLLNPYADKLEKEIRAVETVYNELPPEEQRVMRVRYWKNRRKRTAYNNMGCSYSERQMQRIILKIITRVGRLLGEIE